MMTNSGLMKLLDYNKTPPVAALMQPFPYFAEPDTTVAQVLELMKSHQVRHIPIKQCDHGSASFADRVVGIVSERDLRWMGNPALALPASDEIPVRHVMTYNPYLVEIDTPLTTVISEMTERKIGAAIVISADRLAGIVTVIDICRALGELLDTKFKYKY